MLVNLSVFVISIGIVFIIALMGVPSAMEWLKTGNIGPRTTFVFSLAFGIPFILISIWAFFETVKVYRIWRQ